MRRESGSSEIRVCDAPNKSSVDAEGVSSRSGAGSSAPPAYPFPRWQLSVVGLQSSERKLMAVSLLWRLTA